MQIEITGNTLYVMNQYQHPLLTALASRVGGTWHGSGKPAGRHYAFPVSARDEVLAIVSRRQPRHQRHRVTAQTAQTAEPKAAGHPFGRVIRKETGCTVYRDQMFGGGTVRIYDES